VKQFERAITKSTCQPEAGRHLSFFLFFAAVWNKNASVAEGKHLTKYRPFKGLIICELQVTLEKPRS